MNGVIHKDLDLVTLRVLFGVLCGGSPLAEN